MANNFNSGQFTVPATQVELTVSCRNLIDADIFSKSDPMTVMFVKQFASDSWREFGRTEIIWDNLNPDFVKKFIIDYYFEERQQLRFAVYDIDSQSPDLSKHDFLGQMECSLGEIVSAGRLKRNLKGPKANSGSMVVSSEELSSSKEEARFSLRGVKLDKKDFFGKSDPFLVFSKANEDGTYSVTYKTEVIKNTLDPKWRPFTVPVRTLCNSDHHRSIKIQCYDWNKSGSHEIIGECLVTMNELTGMSPGQQIPLMNERLRVKKGSKYKNSGQLVVDKLTLVPVYSFIDYITGGTQIHATVAVDFTASNGDPRYPQSLHYNHPHQPNQYELAIRSVGEIIQDYDSDKLFPALGFGAKLPPNGQVSHEFFLNGNPSSPYCQGIEGILGAYKHSLNTVQLYGPTSFAPIINHVARFAAEKRMGTDYFILVIITDGIITDMPQTKHAIVNAASLPMSIIIIGVGSADFADMDILDGDDVRISHNGQMAERDIVQFVPFLEFSAQRPGDNLLSVKARLAKEVLAEIPEQFISYMKTRGLKPNPPLPRQSSLSHINSSMNR